MLVTLVTATGARPEAFARCEEYIKRQTYKGPLEWIVVDDYQEKPTKCTLPCQTYIKGPKPWRPGINTQRPNLDAALPYIHGDFIFPIEDDDWYSPNFLEQYLTLLRSYSIVGEGNAVYYNIRERSWRNWSNYNHCSLCQTGFRKEHLPRFEEAINSGELFIDCVLWRIFRDHKLKPFLFANQDLLVGIKGMPGRFGIGAGHTPDTSYTKDPGFKKLEEMIGVADTAYYRKIVSSLPPPAAKQVLTKFTQADKRRK